jgi:hypothetical protein
LRDFDVPELQVGLRLHISESGQCSRRRQAARGCIGTLTGGCGHYRNGASFHEHRKNLDAIKSLHFEEAINARIVN